jgi:hypothetical protein
MELTCASMFTGAHPWALPCVCGIQFTTTHHIYISTIGLFADDCIIYTKIINNKDMEKLQGDLNRLWEWAVEDAMVINPAKSKAVCFTRARVTEPLNYSLGDIVIPEASSCKYEGESNENRKKKILNLIY